MLEYVLDGSGLVRRRTRVGGWAIAAAEVRVINVTSAVKESPLNSSILGRRRTVSFALFKHRESGDDSTMYLFQSSRRRTWVPFGVQSVAAREGVSANAISDERLGI